MNENIENGTNAFCGRMNKRGFLKNSAWARRRHSARRT